MAVVLGWALERGRGAARRVGERLPHQEGSIQTRTLGTAVIRLFCGHRDIYTKAGEKYNENYTGGCSTSRSKNESISGMEALSIHLHKMNHIVGTHQKQVEDCEVDVKGFGFSTRTEFPRMTDSIVLFGTCECDFWGHDVIHPLSS